MSYANKFKWYNSMTRIGALTRQEEKVKRRSPSNDARQMSRSPVVKMHGCSQVGVITEDKAMSPVRDIFKQCPHCQTLFPKEVSDASLNMHPPEQHVMTQSFTQTMEFYNAPVTVKPGNEVSQRIQTGNSSLCPLSNSFFRIGSIYSNKEKQTSTEEDVPMISIFNTNPQQSRYEPPDLPNMRNSGCDPLPSIEKLSKKLQVTIMPEVKPGKFYSVQSEPLPPGQIKIAVKVESVPISKPITYGKKLQVYMFALETTQCQTSLPHPKHMYGCVQTEKVLEPVVMRVKTPEPIVMSARTPDLPDMQDSGCDPLPSVEKISKKLQFRQEIAICYSQISFTFLSLKDKAMSPVRDIFKQCPPADPVTVATQIVLLQRNHNKQTTPEEAMPMVSPFNTNPQQSRYEPMPDNEQELQNILPPKPNVYNSMTQIASLVADEAMEMETEAVPLPELPVQRKSPAWKW